MAEAPIIQTFTKGYNGDASPFVLDLTQVSAVQNLLFERGLLISRPGLTGAAPTTQTDYVMNAVLDGSYMFAQTMRGFAKVYNPSTLAWSLYTINRRKWVAQPFLGDYSITLPAGYITLAGGYPFASYLRHVLFQGVSVVSGFQTAGSVPALLIGNPNAAADPMTGVSLPTRAGYMPALAVHLSRVLVATINNTQVAWSKIGDATIWTGHFTAGSVDLAEADDGISGLAVVRNVVVVGRRRGFHLGIPTGNGANPYDWKKVSSRDKGVFWPDTMAKYGDEIFFVSDTNVHRYDLNQITDIGEGIVTELFGALVANSQLDVKGFVTNSYKPGYRPQYHIIVSSNVSVSPLMHFVYDITEGFWSRHTYSTALGAESPGLGACALIYEPLNGMDNISTVVLMSRPNYKFYYWDYTVACEAAMSFTTGRIQIIDPASEVTTLRMLVVAYCSANATACTATFDSFLGNTNSSTAVSFTLNAGWQRVWVNKIIVGQFFTIKIDVPAGVSVQFRQLILKHEEDAQELRV